ncbi:hypothetical protein D3C85_1637480 [compost metagenome]
MNNDMAIDEGLSGWPSDIICHFLTGFGVPADAIASRLAPTGVLRRHKIVLQQKIQCGSSLRAAFRR